MGKPFSPPLMGKGNVPISLLSPPTLMGRSLCSNAPVYTSTSPDRETNFPSINPFFPPPSAPSTPSSLHLFCLLPPVQTHVPLHHQTPPILSLPFLWKLPTLSLLLPLPSRPNSSPVPFYSLTSMVSYSINVLDHSFIAATVCTTKIFHYSIECPLIASATCFLCLLRF